MAKELSLYIWKWILIECVNWIMILGRPIGSSIWLWMSCQLQWLYGFEMVYQELLSLILCFKNNSRKFGWCLQWVSLLAKRNDAIQEILILLLLLWLSNFQEIFKVWDGNGDIWIYCCSGSLLDWLFDSGFFFYNWLVSTTYSLV